MPRQSRPSRRDGWSGSGIFHVVMRNTSLSRMKPSSSSRLRVLPPIVASLGVVLGGGATALGLLAPWLPHLELINHFRPVLLLAAGAILALAALDGSRRLRAAAAFFAATTLFLAALPFAFRAGAAAEGGEPLKVVTLNVWGRNQDVEAVARFLESERADVVVLQEAPLLQAALLPRVKATYPYAYCPDPACRQAILTRVAPLEVGKEDVAPRRPLLLWARLPYGGRTVKVIGLHIAFPLEPVRQAQHVAWLIGYLGRPAEPTIVAGDFNLTPFSWKFLKLLYATGLRAHLVDRFSWPAHRLTPFVLIDNVLSTPDLGRLSARTGPRVGSDHRAVVVELAAR
jgi:endonuclease/exonuclease/phosphatase (EEP) superfamily protein YafD